MTFKDAAALPANNGDLPITRAEPVIQLRVTPEMLLYVALAALSLVLHLAQLGRAPLNDAEAHEALAALRTIQSQAPGDVVVARSPLTFTLDSISMTFLPPGGLAARLPVALGGVLLTLSPVLWRRYLKPLPPLVISLLLTLSPVVLLASRTMSPVVWTMLLAVVGSWLVLRFVETREPQWGVLATVAFGSLVLLGEPAGFLTLLGLAFGILFAWLTEDDSEGDTAHTIRQVLADWPWLKGVGAAGLVVILFGTGLFFLPSGLTAIGNLLWTGVESFWRRPGSVPAAFPLCVALRYEPGMILFGLVACYRAIREGGFFERALAGWFVIGIVWSLIYAGAGAAHALWVLMPLFVLVGMMVARWLTERPAPGWEVPDWGVPLHVIATFALWVAVGTSTVLLAKTIMQELPLGVTNLGALFRKLFETIYSTQTTNSGTTFVQETYVFVYVLGYIQKWVLFIVLITLLNGLLFFLLGSLWGARTAWRGTALGTLAYLLLVGYGVGWGAAWLNYGDPREFWYVNPVTDDVRELRSTLREMSLRQTGEPKQMDITAWAPQDGALAWALRDYPNTVFVDGVGPETKTAAVLAPWSPQPARMGADYVGKDLIIRQTWHVRQLSWRDALLWFYRNGTQEKPVAGERLMVWIRKDVYGVERVTEN
jgi:hypothetical protein